MIPSRFCIHYVSKSGRPSSGHRTGKGQSSSHFPRRVVPKNVLTIGNARKVIFKILHARLQHYVNQELPDVQAGFRKERTIRDQTANVCWIIEKAREFQKNISLCFMDYAKAFDCVDHNKLWKILQEMGIPDHLTYLLSNLYVGQEATVRTLHEQLTGSGLRKKYDRAVCCQPVYVTYTLSASGEMPGWMSYKLESRQAGGTAKTADMQMTPL